MVPPAPCAHGAHRPSTATASATGIAAQIRCLITVPFAQRRSRSARRRSPGSNPVHEQHTAPPAGPQGESAPCTSSSAGGDTIFDLRSWCGPDALSSPSSPRREALKQRALRRIPGPPPRMICGRPALAAALPRLGHSLSPAARSPPASHAQRLSNLLSEIPRCRRPRPPPVRSRPVWLTAER